VTLSSGSEHYMSSSLFSVFGAFAKFRKAINKVQYNKPPEKLKSH
jgi:hypothetical protein